nr:MAG TPA: hypothetical protein [Caudoviricetes sp.]
MKVYYSLHPTTLFLLLCLDLCIFTNPFITTCFLLLSSQFFHLCLLEFDLLSLSSFV